MVLGSVMLAVALSRAEIIERFQAVPLTKVSGLVQVVADCPADMRREFQSPVASYAADICNQLYRARRMQPRAFPEPGIYIYVGDGRTNDARVVVQPAVRGNGGCYTRLRLPAPASTDLEQLRLEVVRAFFRAVDGTDIDEEAAERALRAADPTLKADYDYAAIERWLKGEPVKADDEEMLRLFRSVLVPGVARTSDVLRFASRLDLYPPAFDQPFCGTYRYCSFAEAVRHLDEDPRLRLSAYLKATEVVMFGCGRGEELAAAADAYSQFLFDLARAEKTKEELLAQLEQADIKLNIALEEARKREEGTVR